MEPIDKLKLLTAWDIEPALTGDELGDTLAAFAIEDANGLAPAHEEWAPTYEINAAAAQAWLIKSARAAAMVDEPTAGVVTSKVFDNCRMMARLYAGKRGTSVAVK